jgi:hypothetical protein
MFAVGYKIEDPDPTKCVRHYLIRYTPMISALFHSELFFNVAWHHLPRRPDDTAGAKKTLPDFLAEQPAFVSVLQVRFFWTFSRVLPLILRR